MIAAAPAALLVYIASNGDWQHRGLDAAVQALVWGGSIGATRTLGGAAITALGPRVSVGRGVLIAAVASTAASVWLPHEHHVALTMLMLGAVVFTAGAAWETFSIRRITPAVRLLLVGMSGATETLINDIRRGRSGGHELVGVVADPSVMPPGGPHVPILGSVDELEAVIAEQRPDLVVLAPGPKHPNTFLRLLDAAESGFRVVQFAEFYEYAFGRVPLEDLPQEWFMSVLHLYRGSYSRLAKRTIDLAGASLLILLTLPLFPLLALLVRQTDGSVIFRQVRLGEHGKLFTLYKFRTMRADAEAPGQAVWAGAADPRVTRAGGFMRRLRLDELPQLWNVIRGDMSLVGPRPERPEFLSELTRNVPYWKRRHLVKPGLTGWAQVRQGYVNSADATSTKLSFDLWYLRHRSLTVDLAILMRTALVVVRGDRAPAHAVGPVPAPMVEPSDT
ncbi:MAG TPA: exopolysaccharide biosynthesis polyprenyl glycosylphosphotransferase [Gaiellaceae bacterium]|nr:exopolysaccharide biosynthesis polyprenyl glycosylphosphotransferase [Gaiellaceae bacterium]